MIMHCPSPYVDEALSSVIARFIDRMGYPAFRSAVKLVFGRATVCHVVDLPGNIARLARFCRPLGGLTADALINDHTLWPFYAAFHSKERRRSVYRQMMGTGHPYLSFGLMANRCPQSKMLRYCPECARDDRSEFGETYWHRIHQVPGVMVCVRHEALLRESVVPYRNARNKHAFITADSVIPKICAPVYRATEQQLQLARDTEWLLQHPSMHIEHTHARELFIQALIDRGYALYSGRVFGGRLKRAMLRQFGGDLLRDSGCEIRLSEYGWVENLLRRRSRVQHPLRYLIVSQFLSITASGLLASARKEPPFGKPPWPCLNRASHHFGTLAITKCDVKLSWNSHRLIARFPCLGCGMVYERTGPDNHVDDRLRRTKIPVYGRVWDKALTSLWTDPSISLRSLCRTLGVNSRTAILQAQRLMLPSRSGLREEPKPAANFTRPASESNLMACRSKWLALRKQNPRSSIGLLRNAEPGLYMLLWRHDRQWLIQNRPNRASSRQRVRIDWQVRDSEIASGLQVAAEKLGALRPPVWLTRTALLREAGSSWVDRKKLRRMPETRSALEASVESRVAFAVRRVRYAMEQIKITGLDPTEWRLIRAAQLRPDIAKERAVRRAIAEALN